MREKTPLPLFFGFAIFLASFSLITSYIQAQSTEADITAFSFPEQTREATLTPNIFDIGLTQINTTSFLKLVGYASGTHYLKRIGLNPSVNTSEVNNIEIRFGQGTQKAHRFTIPAGSGSGVAVTDYTYQGYVDVPFQVWDVDNNKQLMISFRDQQDDGEFDLIEGNTEVGNEANHSREYLFIHNIDYVDVANTEIAVAGGQQFNRLYFLWPYLPTGATFDPNALPVSTLAIEVANSTVEAEVHNGTDFTALIPAITVDANATVSPISGLTNDFTEPRVYKVTAEDGITFEKYLVTVGEDVFAYYPFNGNANDESGNGNDGTINGATLTLDKLGNANSAYSFNFQNTIATPLDLGPDQPFSFSAWVKWDGNLGSFQTILSWWIEGGRVYIDVDPDGQLRFGDFFLNTGVEMPPNEWVHLAGTDDANNFIKLYLNGVLVAEKNTNTNYDPGPMTIGGKMYGPTIVESFSGDIDDIRIYGRVLANNEIVDLSYRALFTETEITTFSIPGQISPAVIDNINYTIDCEVLTGTDVTALVAQFTLSTGASAQVNAMDQVSGTTANDFTSQVTYTITSEEGSSTQDWIVEVAFGTTTLENDSLALLAIYNSTDGANWADTWNLAQTMSTWHGVTINDERVTSLDLNNNDLKGQFPVEIGILTGLTYLDFYGNELSGIIPVEIGNLTNLTYLGLWKNQLSGNIPHEIGLLTELTSLDIGINQFIGTIPDEIWNLTKLEYLGIYSTSITGSIPAQISNLVNLTWLQLLNTQLSGDIPVEIGNLTKLEKLDLWNNELTGTLPVGLGSLTNLTRLNLYDNQLSGSIPSELKNLGSLESLRLDRNDLTGNIPLELGDLINLTNLNLSKNYLTGHLPNELGGLTNLVSLYLNDNNLTGSIPVEFGNLTQLESLWLQFNELDGIIPVELGNLTNLIYLNLPGNNFSGSIPSSLGNTNMTYLYLGDNNLTGTIPPELGNLTNLEDLRFEINNLSGVIPESLGNLPNLNGLILNDNPNLSGSIPQSLTTINLEVFIFQNTNVCEPTNTTYQTWKTTVTTYQASGVVCDITATDMEAFSFSEQAGAATIDLTNHTVAIEVVFATNLTSLVSTFALSSGASAEIGTTTQVSGTTTNDFTNGVTYTVTGEDGTTMQDWVVTVTIGLNTETNILSFSLAEQTGDAAIDLTNHMVAIEVALATDITSLVSTFALSSGATANVGATTQVSGTTANDFTNGVTYTVTGEDGTTMQDWVVAVAIEPNTEADILNFSFAEETGVASIDNVNHTIDVEVATGSILTTLTPTITISDNASVSPDSQVVQDFSNPVIYTVTAQDLITIQDWIVTVVVEPTVLGIDEEIKNIGLYPNPVENQLFLDLEVRINEPLNITVSDLTGRYFDVNQVVGKNNFMINVENYKPGVYLLLIQQGNKKSTLRFIKN